MKIIGFSFIRNAIKYDYPIVEAVMSVMPLCDKFVLLVGQSEDGTEEMLASLNIPNLFLVPSLWNDNIRKGGEVLAEETNKALGHLDNDADWYIYIQGDEAIHEDDYPALHNAMSKYKNDPSIDGLLFDYLHFYGSYDYIATSSKWYKKEVRIIKPNKGIYSYRDAQGFRKETNKKLSVARSNAKIYHYGWVKPPSYMQSKQLYFNKLWHDDAWIETNVSSAQDFDYSQVDILQKFEGKHPKVFQKRITSKNWIFDYDLTKNKIPFKDKCKNWLNRYLGWNLNYQNFHLLEKDSRQ